MEVNSAQAIAGFGVGEPTASSDGSGETEGVGAEVETAVAGAIPSIAGIVARLGTEANGDAIVVAVSGLAKVEGGTQPDKLATTAMHQIFRKITAQEGIRRVP